MNEMDERYSRHLLIAEFGAEGQRALLRSTALIVGCGALGSNLAGMLVRAGVGRVRIIDPDVLHRHNLHRQVLFDEDDVRARRPKAVAAAARLRRINPGVVVEEHVGRLGEDNVDALLQDVDVVLDGLDNFETRYLVNDACIRRGIPWVYGGVIATSGMTMTVVPGRGPCLRCAFPDPPPAGLLPTTDTEGVLTTAPATIAAIQASEAFKLLSGRGELNTRLLHVELWTATIRSLSLQRDPACAACGDSGP